MYSAPYIPPPPKYVSNKGAFDQFGNNMINTANRYNPIVDTGNNARNIAYDQYGRLINNPNAIQDQISSGFYESPFQKYMQDLVQKRMNFNAANTGMLGSGAANRELTNELTKMTGQFQNDYINRGLQSYGQGLSGMGSLSELGFRAMNAQDPLFEQGYGGFLKGSLSENETNQRNAENEYLAQQRNAENKYLMNQKKKSDILGLGGGILSGLGGIAGSFFGGPIGGSIGSGIGNAFSKFFSSSNDMPTATPGLNSFTPATGNWSY